MPVNLFRELWEGRLAVEWQTLAARFEFTGILVPSDWNLKLRTICENQKYKLLGLTVGKKIP